MGTTVLIIIALLFIVSIIIYVIEMDGDITTTISETPNKDIYNKTLLKLRVKAIENNEYIVLIEDTLIRIEYINRLLTTEDISLYIDRYNRSNNLSLRLGKKNYTFIDQDDISTKSMELVLKILNTNYKTYMQKIEAEKSDRKSKEIIDSEKEYLLSYNKLLGITKSDVEIKVQKEFNGLFKDTNKLISIGKDIDIKLKEAEKIRNNYNLFKKGEH